MFRRIRVNSVVAYVSDSDSDRPPEDSECIPGGGAAAGAVPGSPSDGGDAGGEQGEADECTMHLANQHARADEVIGEEETQEMFQDQRRQMDVVLH